MLHKCVITIVRHTHSSQNIQAHHKVLQNNKNDLKPLKELF